MRNGPVSKRLDHCSGWEVTVLTAIIALAAELPEDLVNYTRAIGEMRSRYFGQSSYKRQRPDRHLADGHKPRARDMWA